MNYLENVKFDLPDFEENKLKQKLLTTISSINVENSIPFCNQVGSCNQWWNVNDTSRNQLTNKINSEISSTAFMLRLIANSYVSINNTGPIFSFHVDDPNNVTGIWENDKDRFSIIPYKNVEPPFSEGNNSGKLIMGLGPSASGKTYWAKNAIKIYHATNDSFPSSFITIDGGEIREQSKVFKAIVEKAKNSGFDGICDLANPNKLKDCSGNPKTLKNMNNMFNSNEIKKKMKEFLEKHIGKLNFNLYVPETSPKESQLNKLMKLAGTSNPDDVICLLIYQHKNGKDCPFLDQYKCLGCEASGKNRQKNQGKPYSSGNFQNSIYTNPILALATGSPGAMKFMCNAKNSLIIHNPGQPGKTTIIRDFSDPSHSIFDQEFIGKINDTEYLYIPSKSMLEKVKVFQNLNGKSLQQRLFRCSKYDFFSGR